MDPIAFLTSVLTKYNPQLVGLIPITAPIIKFIVSAIRREFPQWQGNIIQTLTGIVCFIVVLTEALATGAFSHDSYFHVITGSLLVVAINWTGAIGFHNLLQDTNEISSRK